MVAGFAVWAWCAGGFWFGLFPVLGCDCVVLNLGFVTGLLGFWSGWPCLWFAVGLGLGFPGFSDFLWDWYNIGSCLLILVFLGSLLAVGWQGLCGFGFVLDLVV